MKGQDKEQQKYTVGNSCTGGFTLIEVMIAMVVFTIGILAVVTMQTSSVSGNAKARYISEAANYATDRMETLLDTAYSTIVDGAGTNSGLNGLDDGGINPSTTADYSTTSADGLYKIYWNVVSNLPASNSKTIKIIVTNRLLNAPVTITFVKAAGI
ncbi:type IV pilus modification protein PilV [Desulfobacterota bacterium M19]